MADLNPQVPWSEEQWAHLNQVVQEEASRARVAAKFLPIVGPLPPDVDFVRRLQLNQPPTPLPPVGAVVAPPLAAPAQPYRIRVEDRETIRLITLQVRVALRGAQLRDPDLVSAQQAFRRAANVIARAEDAVAFVGYDPDPAPPAALLFYNARTPGVVPAVCEFNDGDRVDGILWGAAGVQAAVNYQPNQLVSEVSYAISQLESRGQYGPFAVVLDTDGFFTNVQTATPASLVLPQDRIIPFLQGGSIYRSSILPANFYGFVVALAGNPIELIIGKDVAIEFIQVTLEPAFIFRLVEKMTLRIKEPEAIQTLV
jgi:uncharacterized linocin/CFP29 family protein